MSDYKKIEEIKEILEKRQQSKFILADIKAVFVSDPIHINPAEKIAHYERGINALEYFLNNLKAEVFFQLGNEYFKLTTAYKNGEKNTAIFNLSNQMWIESKPLTYFFYSVAINYSIHGLNARHIGEWINPLFHKNDAYQTPLVINPMRNNGDIDINNEEFLAKSRLLANILTKTNDKYNFSLTENQVVNRLFFTLNESKVNVVYEKATGATANPRIPVTFEEFYQENIELPNGITINNAENVLFKKIYEILFEENVELNNIENKYSKVPHSNSAKKYIIQKLVKIARKEAYKEYNQFFLGRPGKRMPNGERYRSDDKFSLYEETDETGQLLPSLFEMYLIALKEDNSHITLKLRQAINYLKNNPLKDSNTDEVNGKWSEVVDEYHPSIKFQQYSISAESLSDQLNSQLKNKSDKLIDQLPPSLFYIDIELIHSSTLETSLFNRLSSGEQQHIHSIHSILYHLNNLDSVFYQPVKEDGTKNRQTYQQINIILDEIELYFHPDYQRKFIADLRSGIARLSIGRKDEKGNAKGIQSINILLATHSPFILSDIPSQNVLRLIDGKPSDLPQNETFGANVHDLLHDSFFLEEGFMGKFAKNKINEVINFLNHVKFDQQIIKLDEEITQHPDKKSANTKEINRAKAYKDLLDEKSKNITIEDCGIIIHLIGEPALKKVLLNQYHDLIPLAEESEDEKQFRELANKLQYDIKKRQ